MKIKFLSLIAIASAAIYAIAQNNIAEEVVWVVGDEPIYKSQVEEQYAQITNAGGNCVELHGGDNTFAHCTIARRCRAPPR